MPLAWIGERQMSGENTASIKDAAKDTQTEETEGRQRSSISFPYEDLESAVEIAQALHNHVGMGEAKDEQIAAWTNQSHKSSGFRMQMTAARNFDIIDSSAGRHRLSDLGRMIVDPQRAREARVRAFLNVPLFNAVYEKYKGGVLPPTAAFERDIQVLGVAEKMKDRARRSLEKSAEFAGFFEQGKTRLVRPGVPIREVNGEVPTPSPAQDDATKPKGGGGGFDDHDPLIVGMFRKLPPPETEWKESDRLKWLETIANIFDLVFKGDCSGFVISPARAERSPRPRDHN